MAMDYGLQSPTRNMALDAEQAAENTSEQLGLPLSKISVTPMIGYNDTAFENSPSEIFTIVDAQQFYAWANQSKIHSIGAWSINRDHPCMGPKGTKPNNNCSDVPQGQYSFSSIFQGGNPTPIKKAVTVNVTFDLAGSYYSKEVYLDGEATPEMIPVTDDKGQFKVFEGAHTLTFTNGSDRFKCQPLQHNFQSTTNLTVSDMSYYPNKTVKCTYS